MNPSGPSLGYLKPKCFICFGSETGERWQDHFVMTENGHPYHYCCVNYMMAEGNTTCPVCDENLQAQTLRPLSPPSLTLPVLPPQEGQRASSLLANVEGFFTGTMAPQSRPPTAAQRGPQGNNQMVYAVPEVAWSSGQGHASSAVNEPQPRSNAGAVQQNRTCDSNMAFREPPPPSAPYNTLSAPRRGPPPPRPNPPRPIDVNKRVKVDSAAVNVNASTIPPDYVFKITILGNSTVGKSSLMRRFTDESFNPNINATVGCDLRVKTINIANKVVRLNLWDTAGQERYRQALVGSYLRNTDGIIMCFDVTQMQSVISMEEWEDFALQYAPLDAVKLLVGNKVDMWDRRAVDKHHAMELAERLDCAYLFCSAKDAYNVEAVFRTLTSQILEKRMANDGAGDVSRRREGIVDLRKPSFKLKRKVKENCC